MNDVLRKAEFEKAMSNQREFMRALIKPVADVAIANDKAIAIVVNDVEAVEKAVDDQKKYNRNWDLGNTFLSIVAGIIAGITGSQK